MIIYQLHEYRGEWEDATDYIIGSYFNKERAEEEKVKAEVKEKELRERTRKCNNCPYIENPFSTVKEVLAKHPDYCSKAKLEECDYGIGCENYYCDWDEAAFEIKEVEVI